MQIRFHDWVGDDWCVLFSHPKDFTPVRTTELGAMARLKPEFDRRGCKILGVSVDSVEDHVRWSRDIMVTDAYVCRILPLTCVAPDSVEAMLDGRQPKGLRLAEMLRSMATAWNEQRTMWGETTPRPQR